MADVPDVRAAPGGGLRARMGTVRVRTTLAAVGVVGLALVVGAVGLVISLRRSLTSDLETALELRARDVIGSIEAGTSPAALTLDEGEDRFVQVIAGGRVVAASGNLVAPEPVVDVAIGDFRRADAEVMEDGEREAESFLVFADLARTPDGAVTVLVGRTREFVTESTGFVTGVMLVGLPFVIAVVGATGWWLVGRALRPVDAIRDEVDHISERALERRVPTPGTGDEIARLADTMNRMLERLDEAQTRQRRFVSDAGHELRSPLATIRHHAEVARIHPDRSSVEELAEVVVAEGERLGHLVDDLLLLARVDEGRSRITRDPVDLDDLVFEEAERLRAATGLRIDTTSVSAGRVRGDESRLRRLVRNLGDNAARHAESTVVFELRTAGTGEVVLSVDDDGSGIPPAERERVFERFVRLDEARAREEGGTGLGLAIVDEIARAHEGSVAVGESPLGGARFEVKLPSRPC